MHGVQGLALMRATGQMPSTPTQLCTNSTFLPTSPSVLSAGTALAASLPRTASVHAQGTEQLLEPSVAVQLPRTLNAVKRLPPIRLNILLGGRTWRGVAQALAVLQGEK